MADPDLPDNKSATEILADDSIRVVDKALADAERAGFDLNLIDINLSLSPKERVEQHQSALDLVEKLLAIKRRRDEYAQ